MVNKQKRVETISKQAEMDRKSSQTVTNSKQVAIDKNMRKWVDKNTKIVLNQLAKDTQPNKAFKSVLRLSEAIPDIL